MPITRKDKEWYLHLLPGKQQELHLKTDLKPVSVRLLQTNESVKYRRKGKILLFDLPKTSNGLDDVIVITWKEAPKDQ